MAKYAASFADIDDARAFDFNYTVSLNEGEIAVFLSPEGAVLVKVAEVNAGVSNGAAQRFLKMKFEVRPK